MLPFVNALNAEIKGDALQNCSNVTHLPDLSNCQSCSQALLKFYDFITKACKREMELQSLSDAITETEASRLAEPIPYHTDLEEEFRELDKYDFVYRGQNLLESELTLHDDSNVKRHNASEGEHFVEAKATATAIKVESDCEMFTESFPPEHFDREQHRNINLPLECDERFFSYTQMKVHIRCHAKRRPFACIYCDKSFAIRNHLTVHEKKHTGLPYQCDDCGNLYCSESGFWQHLYNHSGMLYKCVVCDKGYASIVSIKRHLRTTHRDIVTHSDNLADMYISSSRPNEQSTCGTNCHDGAGRLQRWMAKPAQLLTM